MRTHKTATIISALTLFLGLICTLLSFILNNEHFQLVTGHSIVPTILVQSAALIFLFVIGYILLKLIQDALSEIWVLLLSFPAGITLYVISSTVFLLLDLTMRFERVCICILAILIILYVMRRKTKRKIFRPNLPIFPTISIVIGIILILSSGLTFIVANFDSYFYFSDYGITLSKFMCYKDFVSDNSYVLTNIGQFLPVAASYNSFWGINNPFPIHSAFLMNATFILSYGMYESLVAKFSKKRAICITALFTLAFYTCSPVFLFGHWLLSNTWIMFYVLIFLIISQKYLATSKPKIFGEFSLILFGCILSVTMLRKDGMIIACFLMLCLSISQSLSKDTYGSPKERFAASAKLGLILLPAVLYMCVYLFLLKNVLYATTQLAYSDSLLAPRSLAIPIIGLMTLLYLFFLFRPIELICKKKITFVATGGLLLLIIIYAVKDPYHFIDYIDVWSRNFGGIAFGFSIFLIILLLLIILTSAKHYDAEVFCIIGYILLIIALYWNKGNMETDIDNSGLRAMCQIIPCIFYVAADKLSNHNKHG